jgi:hypothetical protein
MEQLSTDSPMSDKRPLHDRYLVAYLLAGVLINVVAGLVKDRIDVRPGTAMKDSVPLTQTGTNDSKKRAISDQNDAPGAARNSQQLSRVLTKPPSNAHREGLNAEYESLISRFSAIDKSLTQRAHDLGDLPIKPEIASALELCRSDLAAAQAALYTGNSDLALSRMNRVREKLRYLESL